MRRVVERRRHARLTLSYPATIRDRSGKVLMRGRSADISVCGIRVLGPGGSRVEDAQTVWIELEIPNPRRSGPPTRVVKMCGQVRRVAHMGDWNAVTVVLESNFSPAVLSVN
jgi:hypothetical protein